MHTTSHPVYLCCVPIFVSIYGYSTLLVIVLVVTAGFSPELVHFTSVALDALLLRCRLEDILQQGRPDGSRGGAATIDNVRVRRVVALCECRDEGSVYRLEDTRVDRRVGCAAQEGREGLQDQR